MFVGESIATVFFKKYASFSGRASRSEFWWAVLFFYVPVSIMLFVLQPPAGDDLNDVYMPYIVWAFRHAGDVPLLWLVAYLGIEPPLWAVTTRRLHDTGHAGRIALAWFVTRDVIGVYVCGWFTSRTVTVVELAPGASIPFPITDSLPPWVVVVWFLFLVFMLVFGLVMLWFMCKRGDDGANAYGPPPRR